MHSKEAELNCSKFQDLVHSSPLLNKAYVLTQTLHEGQFRKSGEPYFSHCFVPQNF